MVKRHKQAKKKTANAKKDRGIILTISLILLIFGILESLYNLTINSHNFQISGLTWFPQYYFIELLITTMILIGLWLWKKWTIYLILIRYALTLAIFSIMPTTIGYKLLIISFSVIVGSIWLWAIYRKWEYFE